MMLWIQAMLHKLCYLGREAGQGPPKCPRIIDMPLAIASVAGHMLLSTM